MKNVFLSGAITTANTAIATSVGYANNAPNSTLLGTQVGADWYNMVTSEIMSVVTAAGLTPSGTTWTQLLTAIETITAGNATPVNQTSNRAFGTSYTNTLNHPVFVSIIATVTTGAGNLVGKIDSIVLTSDAAPTGSNCGITMLVPVAGTYSANFSSGTGTIVSWYEQ